MPKTGLKGPKMGANQGIFKHPSSTGRCRVHDWAGVVNSFSCGVLPLNFQKQSTDWKYLDRFTRNSLDKTCGQAARNVLFSENRGFLGLFSAGCHSCHDWDRVMIFFSHLEHLLQTFRNSFRIKIIWTVAATAAPTSYMVKSKNLLSWILEFGAGTDDTRILSSRWWWDDILNIG